MSEIKRSFCRNCGAQCGLELEIEDGRILDIRADRSNPVTGGYFCIKALGAMDRQNGKDRLLTALCGHAGSARQAIPTRDAIKEIANRLSDLVERHGPRSIGIYYGTGAYTAALTLPFAKAWLEAIGSPQLYSAATIDQSPKFITALRMGAFKSGRQPFASSDVWLLSATNPLISHWGGYGGITPYSPLSDIRAARKRGLKLIVIDPRRTETARQADLFLQPRPGQDVAVHAAILNHILANELFDKAFCESYVKNLDVLREKVAAYDLETAAGLSGVPAGDIRAPAELFARGPRGCATSGTGGNMAPFANLAEHLLECINIVCGRYRRAGEPVLNPALIVPGLNREGVVPAFPLWDHSPRMSSHPDAGHAISDEFATNLLAGEILHEGEELLRALIVLGGNPVVAIPDYEAVKKAFESLELLVTMDVQATETTAMSHYVLPCTTPFERAEFSGLTDGNSPGAVFQYSAAIMQAPPKAMEEWEIFYELAAAMELKLEWEYVPMLGMPTGRKMRLDMTRKPSCDEMFDFICQHPDVPFARMKKEGAGRVALSPRYVLPPDPDDEARLDVMPGELIEELAECLATRQGQHLRPGDLLLHSRRLPNVMNSNYIDTDHDRLRYAFNPLYMHPEDMAERGLTDGEEVEVASSHGKLIARVRADSSERRGAISMHHAWAKRYDRAGEQQRATPVSVLIDKDGLRERHNFVPRMSAIPVRVSATMTRQ
ncbi:molybdopterin-containing oxidoreductase family protein [Flavisphingomonas formosensis]|uniref:molybdopterin-containing oxidoreductase family protein n=1 Tax=Flavisphingomonas formosensis TaxID=861534 RepID=UPI0012F83C56|nr:molybdopterin-dependent oxidoreductase [Sphingomonas formosensis]